MIPNVGVHIPYMDGMGMSYSLFLAVFFTFASIHFLFRPYQHPRPSKEPLAYSTAA